MIAQVLDFYSV